MVGFRLRVRCAKILGYFGIAPLKVSTDLKECYQIRSTFLHGHQLTERDKAKLLRKLSYESLDALLLSLFDYLRVAIIFMMFEQIKYATVGKNALITLIDNSLIDNSLIDRNADRELTYMAGEIVAAANAWQGQVAN